MDVDHGPPEGGHYAMQADTDAGTAHSGPPEGGHYVTQADAIL